MPRRVSSPEFVGRADGLEQLARALAESAEGTPTHVLVIGEAGVGKTRLLAQSQAQASGTDARALLGGCVSVGDSGLPFAPFAEIIRGLVAADGASRVAALAGPAVHDLARLVPELGDETPSSPQELLGQTRIYEALLTLFRRVAHDRPLVLQLEDLHWADAGTLAATSFLFRAVRHEPIALVGTLRPVPSDDARLRAWLAEASRLERVERLELQPFDEAEVSQLLASITGSVPSRGEAAEIHRRSDGNAYFVEELLAAGDVSGEALPTTLRDVLLARADGLATESRRLLDVASAGGRDIDADLLERVAQGWGVEPEPALRELVDAGLLAWRSTGPDEGIAFRHALLQEAVYGAMLPPGRRRLHQAFGEALVARDGLDIEDAPRLISLAYHLRQARDPRAGELAVRAGDAAMAEYAHDIAQREYEAALRLADRGAVMGSPEVDRAELLRRLGTAATFASDFRRGLEAFRQALDELPADAPVARRSRLKGQLGRAYWLDGDWEPSVAAYEEALELASEDEPVARIRALAGLAQVYMLFGWDTRARPLAEEAATLARQADAPALESHALTTLSIPLAVDGEAEASMAAVKRALQLADELGLADDLGRAYVQWGDALALLGDPAQALEVTLVGIEAVEARGMALSFGVYLRYNGVHFAYHCGRWETARQLIDEADRLAPDSAGIERYRMEYGLSYLVSSGSSEASDLWTEALARIEAAPSSSSVDYAYAAGMELAALADDPAEAMRVAAFVFDHPERSAHSERLSELARIAAWPLADLARSGAADVPAMQERFDRLERASRSARARLADPAQHQGQLMAHDLEQIRAERGRSEGASDPRAWAAVATGWQSFGRPYQEAYARWRQAEAAAAAGDRDEAGIALAEADRLCRQLGAGPLGAHVDALARQLRVRLGDPDAVASTPFGLTRREQEVLALVAAGMTNKAIAAELFISESTAGVHVSNILGKLGVSSRTKAARVALTQGLVTE
jgi:DNA-binding CsgD family transcriptional regulator/tetratricopeptide (TPR) repeat protein